MDMIRIVRLAVSLAVAGSCMTCWGAWPGITQLGRGGEPTVTHDGAGTVYVTSHLPTQVFVSRNYGMGFEKTVTFAESLGDMVCLPLAKGEVMGVFMPPKINGLLTRLSTDYGKSWVNGEGIMGRPLDREWPVRTPDGNVYMIYSDGYIGGPDSKGIYLSRSSDKGLSWKEVGRVDPEGSGRFAVDPHIVASTKGRLYAYWAVSEDKDTVKEHRFGYSTDGGKTWKSIQALNTTRADLGDTQERWMLGGLAASGELTVVCYFVGYQKIGDEVVMTLQYRKSVDGGVSFSESKSVTALEDLKSAMKNRLANKVGDGIHDLFKQSTAWATFDPMGNLYFVWYESKGQKNVDGKILPVWELRGAKEGSKSEAIGHEFAAVRPPMDFISCVADSKNLYVAWVETPDMKNDWQFSGQLWFGKKDLGKF